MAFSLAIVAGLGTSACDVASAQTPPETVTTQEGSEGPSLTYDFHQNGTLEIVVDNSGLTDYQSSVNKLFEFCQGNNLVITSENNPRLGWDGGGIAISPNDSACSDGKLTQSDFPNIK